MESIYAEVSACAERGSNHSREVSEGRKCKDRCTEDQISQTFKRGPNEALGEIRRNSKGTIDFQYYHDRAMHLRSEEIARMAKRFKRLIAEVIKTLYHVGKLTI